MQTQETQKYVISLSPTAMKWLLATVSEAIAAKLTHPVQVFKFELAASILSQDVSLADDAKEALNEVLMVINKQTEVFMLENLNFND